MLVVGSKQQPDGWWQAVGANGLPVHGSDSALAKEFEASGVHTINDVFHFTAEKYKDKECLGTRRLLIRHSSTYEGKQVEKLELGEYQWHTYSQIYDSSTAVARALNDLGYQCGERIALFAETRADWLIAAAGILQQRMVVCTLYTTLSNSSVIHALNETEVPVVFTSYNVLPLILSVISQCPAVKTVVIMEDQLEGIGDVSSFPQHVNVMSFQSLISRGKKCAHYEPPKQEASDTAIIMYTSGSTGTPKGVELTHTNTLSFVLAYYSRIPVGPKDRYLAFLPLAHIMELVTEMSLLACGIKVFYSSPGTFTSSSVKVFPGTDGDAKIAKPTVMNCVPLVLDKVIKSVTQKVEQQGWLKSFVFKKLVHYKMWMEYIPFTSSILDLLVFKKVKIELGGELKTIVAGGAPLSVQTQEQFRALFGCNLQVGYGSTETAANVTCMTANDPSLGNTGPPNMGLKIKLVNWEEGGYRSTDKPRPRGEIVVSGPSVARGYFKRPEETAAAFFEENGMWCFHTGDIGEIDERGSLKIIDRMKDLVKMKHGEYISLGNIESVLKTLPLVDNICVFADTLQDRVVAVVVPVASSLLTLALEEPTTALTNPDLSNMAHLYTNKNLVKTVLNQMQQYGKQCQLNKWETPVAVYLTGDSWLPESNLVTAALKLRRKQMTEKYGAQVQALYAGLESRL